jgi:NADH-quinone oxidoreductase subunit M
MQLLDYCLLPLAGLILLLLLGRRWRGVSLVATLFYGALLARMLADYVIGITDYRSGFALQAFGDQLTLHLTGLGWFFALITVGAAFFASWYMTGEWGEAQPDQWRQQGLLALNVTAMLLLLSAGDLLTLFIGWELVSWAGYAMMVQQGGRARDAAFRYLLYALSGAMLLLLAIVMLRLASGTFRFEAARAAVDLLSPGRLWLLVGLLAAGFGVKMALFPLHLWQADAYSQTPGASSSFLNAISARIALFALIVSLVQIVGLDRLAALDLGVAWLDARVVLMWLAAITLVVPTFIALRQTDAMKLLTWHGIGQGGYMLLGVLVATPLGTAGGLLHALNFAICQAALVLAVTAVVHRAKTSDLDQLGGLVSRMPATYVTLLMGVLGLAGLPPMNGFVSTWMIYKSLLEAHQPLLLLAAFVGTLGTILSVYKLVHSIFLGRLRREHRSIREVPFSMLAPMLLLAGTGFVTGVMPGLALDLVDVAQAQLPAGVQPHTLGGIALASGSLDMLCVAGVMLGAIAVGAVILGLIGGQPHRVRHFDHHAGGHVLSADISSQVSHELTPGLARVVDPWHRGLVRLEQALVSAAQVLSDAVRGLYRIGHTPLAPIAGLVLGLVWIIMGGGR